MTGGTGSASNPRDGTPYIGKTGTANKAQNTWMVGSSTRVATAVWVGNIRGEQSLARISVNGVYGGTLRHAIFKPIALAIDARYPGGAFPEPDPSMMTGTPVIVPDNLVGGTPEQAKAAIELAKLSYEDGGQMDSDLPVGTVVATDPASGASVPKGTAVQGVHEQRPGHGRSGCGDAEPELQQRQAANCRAQGSPISGRAVWWPRSPIRRPVSTRS